MTKKTKTGSAGWLYRFCKFFAFLYLLRFLCHPPSRCLRLTLRRSPGGGPTASSGLPGAVIGPCGTAGYPHRLRFDGSVPHQPPPAAPCDPTTDQQCPPAPKKRAVDQAPEDTTSSPEDVVEMGQVAFTPVTYKKKRTAGIPVVFQPTAAGCSFWKVNPNISEVVATAQEKVLTHRLNKDGSLMVTVSTLAAANRLLQTSSLAGITTEARVPHSYMATYGRIQGVPLEYTDEDLGRYLSSQGVISARRQVSYARNDDSVVTESRRRSVILEFKSDSPLPERVFLGFCSFPVTEYMG